MEAPKTIPTKVLRSIVRHARDRAISTMTGNASGLRRRLLNAQPDRRDDGTVRYGDSPWRGIAWKQTDEVARSVLEKLRWHGDHYAWTYAGMYIGIELDGYMHT